MLYTPPSSVISVFVAIIIRHTDNIKKKKIVHPADKLISGYNVAEAKVTTNCSPLKSETFSPSLYRVVSKVQKITSYTELFISQEKIHTVIMSTQKTDYGLSSIFVRNQSCAGLVAHLMWFARESTSQKVQTN